MDKWDELKHHYSELEYAIDMLAIASRHQSENGVQVWSKIVSEHSQRIRWLEERGYSCRVQGFWNARRFMLRAYGYSEILMARELSPQETSPKTKTSKTAWEDEEIVPMTI